ncbi:hypothetical protein LTR37_016314 [Vermiconidia calcicola]|uniref:Uncharacterized protein n=1 Tax=Vermiconidia calcicola TaxID=1690605 RepID=A0ACC3MN82_9PEZI|nr:hypothetical protein LTR37_016314 [Vermiconidia calcicola]
MPSKASSSPAASQRPTEEQLRAINNYLSKKPDFDKLIQEANQYKQDHPTRLVKSEYDSEIKAAVKAVFEERQEGVKSTQAPKMPVGVREEEAGSNLTDLVAKQSKDSTASDHQLHDTETTDTGHTKETASMEHHKANPGPVISQDIGEPASKDELKKRSEELNKK